MQAIFSAPVQAGPGAHPSSYTVGTGSFPGVKRPGRGIDNPPHLAPRLKKEYNTTSTPPLGIRALFLGDFYLYQRYNNNLVTNVYIYIAIPSDGNLIYRRDLIAV